MNDKVFIFDCTMRGKIGNSKQKEFPKSEVVFSVQRLDRPNKYFFFFWEFSHRPKFKKFHTYMQDAIVTANFIEDLPKSRLQAEANSTFKNAETFFTSMRLTRIHIYHI